MAQLRDHEGVQSKPPTITVAQLLREWFRPALKCERVGHRIGTEFRKGFRRPDFNAGEHRWYVCMGVTEERASCLRCGTPLGEWQEKQRSGFTGYSWPSSQADTFKRDGVIWTASGWRTAARVHAKAVGVIDV